MPAKDVGFFDFERRQFPVQIWALDARTCELRWHVKVDGMAAVLLPGKTEVNDGRPVTVVVRDALGQMHITGPQ